MDERMTICNMSIEGGARAGYVNPDQVTFDYLRGRPFAPQGDEFEKACRWWSSMASDPNASYDDEVEHRRGIDPADGHLGDQPGSVGVRRRAAAEPASCRESTAPRSTRRSSSWASRAGIANPGTQDRCRVRWLVHERPVVRSARGREGDSRPPRRAARSRAGRARDRSRCGWPPSEKDSTESSSTPDSTGAAPAVRCASR